jgi:hypothetical protein
MFVTVLTIALVALTPVNPGTQSPDPVLFGGGGPDLYGYRYLDSDTTCPGAPTYNWIELKGVGTEITNLMGDDNVVGPFPLGFEFPFYWYRVTQCHIGSNGYLAFHDGTMNASPFQRIPSPSRSNNTLAAMLSDLFFDRANNATLWYWTSPNQDSFIIEYDSVPFWSTGGNNSFQIILSKPDSSITFQYKEQSGVPFNGWVPDANQCGVENVSGAVGLNYLSGNTPPGNMYHTGLAVRFFPPESTTYVVHDAGVRNAMNDRSAGMFAINGDRLRPWAVVRNYGNQSESPFPVYIHIARSNGTIIFRDTMQAAALAPGQTDSIVGNRIWACSTGTYQVRIFTVMTGDMMRGNDSAKVELRVIPNANPASLTYTDTARSYMQWNGPGGFGNRYVAPVYPCSVTSIAMHMQAAASTPTVLALFDDNGPGGGPGDTLAMGTVNVTAAAWYTVNVSPAEEITEGAFFVGGMSSTSSAPSFGMDSVPPLSYQGWEYTGVWAPGRDAPLRDVVSRVAVRGIHTGVEEWLQPVSRPIPVRITVNPNPAAVATELRLASPRGDESSIEIYDAAGNVLRTLTLDGGVGQLDVRGLADGIYFARVTGTESPVAKVIVTR